MNWIRLFVWDFNSVPYHMSQRVVKNTIGAEQEIPEIFNPFHGSDVLGKVRHVGICLFSDLNKRLLFNTEGPKDLIVVHVGRSTVAANFMVVVESERSDLEEESVICRYNALWSWSNSRNHNNMLWE